MSRNRWRFVMSGLAVGVYMVCVEWRAYPQQVALLVSISAVALAYSCRRTFYEMRRILRSEAHWERDEPEAPLPEAPPTETPSPQPGAPPAEETP